MELKDQVCSLESAKRLKELGFKQESLFQWKYWEQGGTESGNEIVLCPDQGEFDQLWIASAFTTSELGEMLPMEPTPGIYFETTRISYGHWVVQYQKKGNRNSMAIQMGKTEAEARARMLIHLTEQGHINPKDMK